MKQILILLFLSAGLCCAGAETTAERDSIGFVEKVKVHGNVYTFIKYEQGFQTLLKVFLIEATDSTLVFEGPDSYHFQDCNSGSSMASTYEIQGDKLVIWYYETYDLHMDDRYHHYTSTTKKETYAIQKKGPIVRLKTEYGKKDPELDKLIREMLGDKLSQQDNRE
jgi:hypothetical protein